MKTITFILILFCGPLSAQSYIFKQFATLQGADKIYKEKGTLTLEGEFLTFRSQTINFKMIVKGETKKGVLCSVFTSLCKDYFKIHYTNEGKLKTIFIKKGGKLFYLSKNMIL